MTKQFESLNLSCGRDYNTYNRYEYCLFSDDELVARKGGFKANAQAKKAGVAAAQDLLAPALI